MKKKQFQLGLCLWLLFNGSATLIRLGAQGMDLYLTPPATLLATVLVPAVTGLTIFRWLPLRACLLVTAMAFTSLLFSLWFVTALLPINGIIACLLAGEVLAGNVTKDGS